MSLLPPIAIFLCDKTGRAALPWAEAGVECWCVDIQHSIRKDRREGLINFVWGDVRTWRPPEGRRIVFVAVFSPCTDMTVAGARDFAKKGGYMLRDGLEMFEAGRQAAAWSGAPYYCENPVGVLSSIPHIGKPDFYFHPSDYAGYLPEADQVEEAYTKKTCLWTGNGFVMPDKRPVEPSLGSKMWLMPPSDDRADLRSATPVGFSKAVCLANLPQDLRMRSAA